MKYNRIFKNKRHITEVKPKKIKEKNLKDKERQNCTFIFSE